MCIIKHSRRLFGVIKIFICQKKHLFKSITKEMIWQITNQLAILPTFLKEPLDTLKLCYKIINIPTTWGAPHNFREVTLRQSRCVCVCIECVYIGISKLSTDSGRFFFLFCCFQTDCSAHNMFCPLQLIASPNSTELYGNTLKFKNTHDTIINFT